MPEGFHITQAGSRGAAILLRVQGHLDSKSASQLLSHCSAIRSSGKNLVLNLSGVSFIASSGIGALLALVEQFRESGGKVRFVALSSAVESVIRLLNLDQFLTIDPTEDDAVSALGA
jgi:anti-sigma B factor antagonist